MIVDLALTNEVRNDDQGLSASMMNLVGLSSIGVGAS